MKPFKVETNVEIIKVELIKPEKVFSYPQLWIAREHA
jgi:hypothetical protein